MKSNCVILKRSANGVRLDELIKSSPREPTTVYTSSSLLLGSHIMRLALALAHMTRISPGFRRDLAEDREYSKSECSVSEASNVGAYKQIKRMQRSLPVIGSRTSIRKAITRGPKSLCKLLGPDAFHAAVAVGLMRVRQYHTTHGRVVHQVRNTKRYNSLL